jgi:hypothetical protein
VEAEVEDKITARRETEHTEPVDPDLPLWGSIAGKSQGC